MPAQKNLTSLFNPKSIAVVGASNDPQKLGAIVFKNILDSEYIGKVYPVNPNYESLKDVKCYKNVGSLPETPDLAILAVPASAVLAVLKESAQKGIKNVLVFAAGYKETGPQGEKLEKELADFCNQAGINLLGPNCLGFVNNQCSLNATFGESVNKMGNLRFISQSGAITAAFFDWCLTNDVGFNTFVTLGNKAVINENHVLDYFLDELNAPADPNQAGLSQLNPIGLYLEAISDGAEFLRIAKELSKKNPIFLLKPGKTPAATQAMHSHTGAIAQEDDILQALVEQAGITRCQTLQDFFDFAKAFSWEDLPQGPNVAVISNAGGPAVVSADAIALEGLSLAGLSEETKSKLGTILPKSTSVTNPVDVLGDALADRYAQTLDVLLQDKGVDSLLVILTPQIMTEIKKTAEVVKQMSQKYKKPVFCSFMGGKAVAEGKEILNACHIPWFDFPERAILVISAMYKYNATRTPLSTPNQNLTAIVSSADTVRNTTSSVIQAALNNNQHTLDNLQASELISGAGISTPPTQSVKTLEEAVGFAGAQGWPVVLKLSSPGLLHKREVGGVILDIPNEEALDNAWHQLERKVEQLDVSIRQHLTFQIQKDVPSGVEVIVGVKQDPTFGSVLLFGAGGMFAELISDKNLRLLPLTPEDAKQLVQKSKVFKTLKGTGSEPACALDKLYDLIIRMGALAQALPQIKEIEINPVIVNINDVWAVDTKVVLKEEGQKAPAVAQFRLAGTTEHKILASKFHYYSFESEKPLVFRPGQYVSIKVAPNTIRAYSIAGHTDDRHFNLLVDTRPGGPGSKFFENLKVSDVTSYMGPFGVFTFNPNDNAETLLFLATGSGISAIRCMIDAALSEYHVTKPIQLYFGLTHEGEIFWQDHFDKLSAKYPNFKYQIALCKPTGPWKGPIGFINQLVEKDFPNAGKCAAYLCGNKNMITDATALLQKLGCPTDRIYHERFV